MLYLLQLKRLLGSIVLTLYTACKGHTDGLKVKKQTNQGYRIINTTPRSWRGSSEASQAASERSTAGCGRNVSWGWRVSSKKRCNNLKPVPTSSHGLTSHKSKPELQEESATLTVRDFNRSLVITDRKEVISQKRHRNNPGPRGKNRKQF